MRVSETLPADGRLTEEQAFRIMRMEDSIIYMHRHGVKDLAEGMRRLLTAEILQALVDQGILAKTEDGYTEAMRDGDVEH